MKNTVWSNRNLKLEDWREDLLEEYPNATEKLLRELMVKTNDSYFDDERMNLLATTVPAILVLSSIRTTTSVSLGFKVLKSEKDNSVSVSRCLNKNVIANYEFDVPHVGVEYDWFVDADGEFRCEVIRDGCKSRFLYRAFNEGVNVNDVTEQMCLAKELNDDRLLFNELVQKHTSRLGDAIGKVYGWVYPSVKS